MFLLLQQKNKNRGEKQGVSCFLDCSGLGFHHLLHPCVFSCKNGEEPGRESSAGNILDANIMLALLLIFTVFTCKCKQLLT